MSPKSYVHTRNQSTAQGFTMQDIDTATHKVFDLLDSDKDGLISETNIDIS